MKRAVIPSQPQKPDPYEAELDRLLALRERGYITKKEYEDDVRAVERARSAEMRR